MAEPYTFATPSEEAVSITESGLPRIQVDPISADTGPLPGGLHLYARGF